MLAFFGALTAWLSRAVAGRIRAEPEAVRAHAAEAAAHGADISPRPDKGSGALAHGAAALVILQIALA